VERVFRDSVITVGAKLLVAIIGLVISVVIARMLGPTWRGYLALIMLPHAIFLIVAPLGINRGNLYSVGKEPERVGDIVNHSLWSGLIIGTVCFVIFVFYTYTGQFAVFSKGLRIGFFLLITITFPLMLISLYFDAIIHGRDLILIRNLKEIFVNALVLLVLLFGFYVLHKGLLAPVLSVFVGTIVGFFLSIFLVHKYVSKLKLRRVNWGYLRKNFAFGFKNHISAASVMLIASVMILMARHRIPIPLDVNRFQVSQIAFLAMAVAWFERGMMLPRSISFALLPKLTSAGAKDALKYTLKVSRYNVVFTLVIFILLYFLIEPLVVLLYGEAYQRIAIPFKALVPGAICLSFGEVWATGLFARRKTNAILLAGILGLLTAVVSGYYLLFFMKIKGAGLTCSAGFFVYALVLLIAFALDTPFRSRDMFVLGGEDIAEIKAKFSHKNNNSDDND
jgi:O-antigen/teichoic acid export membrane protein